MTAEALALTLSLVAVVFTTGSVVGVVQARRSSGRLLRLVRRQSQVLAEVNDFLAEVSDEVLHCDCAADHRRLLALHDKLAHILDDHILDLPG
jgi:hypothetical protein